MSWRRLWVLVNELPPESRTKTEIRGFDHWSITDHLLAGVCDRIAVGNYYLVRKGRKPRPLPRPGENRAKVIGTVALSPAEFDYRLAEARKRGESYEVDEVI